MKKKKRKSRYKTGIHTSEKLSNGPMHYRSGWELVAATYFDQDQNVVSYSYESIVIPYISNLKTGRVRRYYPDFLVVYKDGTRKLIEVKRGDKIANALVIKKSNAARVWCEQNGVIFEIWANHTIKKLNELNSLQKVPTTLDLTSQQVALALLSSPLLDNWPVLKLSS